MEASFYYDLDEIVEAQRSRFTSSPQIKGIFLLGILFSIGDAILEYTVGVQREKYVEPWVVPSTIAGIFIGIGILLYFFAPKLDFNINHLWKRKFTIKILPESIDQFCEGTDFIVRYKWENFSSYIEITRSFILYFDTPQAFLIIPKRIFDSEKTRAEFIKKLKALILQKST